MAYVCTQITEWIEEEISRPVEQWVEKSEEKCKKLKWYDPRRWLCWIVTTLVKVIRWVLVTIVTTVTSIVCRLVSVILSVLVDLFQFVWHLLAALFTWDKCRLQEAVGELVNALSSTLTGFGYVLISPVVERINRYRLRNYVDELIKAKFAGRPEDISHLVDKLRLSSGSFGLRLTVSLQRTYLDSQKVSDPDQFDGRPDIWVLHDRGTIDLYELCGFAPRCALTSKTGWYRPRYHAGTFPFASGGGGFGPPDPPALTKAQLDTYVESEGQEGPNFRIYPMSNRNLGLKTASAKLKGRQLGLTLAFDRSKDLEVWEPAYINYMQTTQVRFLRDKVGRTDIDVDRARALSELCEPVAIGVFGFTNRTLRGLSTNLFETDCLHAARNISARKVSGVTFIDDIPDALRRYILIHELAHYFGLCHVSGFDRIMVSGAEGQGSLFSWKAIPNAFLHGGPRFTLDEGKRVWRYILDNWPEDCLLDGRVID